MIYIINVLIVNLPLNPKKIRVKDNLFIMIIIPFFYRLNINLEDSINKKQYSLIKNHLNKYEWYIDNEYSMATETIYDEYSGMLLIALDIIIPKVSCPDMRVLLLK